MKKRIHNQIDYWAHMLDESSHASYYEVYMQEHPEDELRNLIDTMLGEFADDLEKNHINLRQCVKDGFVQDDIVEKMAERVKYKYYWERIRSQTYAAIVSRMTALLNRSKN